MESKGTGAEIKAAPAAPRLAISGTGSGKNASKTSKSKSKSTKQYAESIAEYHAIACVGPREHDFFSKEFNAEAVLCENVRVPVPVPSAKLFDNVGMAKRIAESPLEQAARRVPVATPKPGISRGHVCRPAEPCTSCSIHCCRFGRAASGAACEEGEGVVLQGEGSGAGHNR